MFERLASRTATFIGRPYFLLANISLVVVWLVAGPFLGFSDTWQLVLTTTFTITSQLFIILLQNAQTRDTLALHLKLDEILRAIESADSKLAGAEDFSISELEELIRKAKQ